MIYQSFIKPLLFRLDAEEAHQLTLKAAKKASRSKILAPVVHSLYDFQSPVLSQQFWGLTFRNPVGLAAGFDKNARLVEAMQSLGMGFTEIGSITAEVSGGNPKPRAFRLPEDRALINRMGLNNEGAQTVMKRLQSSHYLIPVGVNIAKTPNREITGKKAIEDYKSSYQEAQAADYITLNISCPNTEDGKTFEEPQLLDELLSSLFEDSSESHVPTLVKFSSDVTKTALREIADVCERHQIAGYVACNTSSSRQNLITAKSTLATIGKGGLSGAPIAGKSMQVVKWLRQVIPAQKPIIGVGGIDSFESALCMFRAGANLLQLYTGLIYEGPGLVKKINRGLASYISRHGFH